MSVTTQNLNENEFFQSSTWKTVKEVGAFIGVVLAAPAVLIVIVALPIIGALGTPLALLSAGYHFTASIYHERHTRKKDKNENFISGTEFSKIKENTPEHYNNNLKSHFDTREDCMRLQHEVDRIYHDHAMIESLKWAGCLFKTLIPIIGIGWIQVTEGGKNGCFPEKIDKKAEDQKLRIETNLEFRLAPLREKFGAIDLLLHPDHTVFENVPPDLHSSIESYLEAMYNPNPYPANSGTS